MKERQKKKVRELVAQDLTVPEIAKRMRSVSQQSIYRLIQKEGLKVRKLRGRLPEDLDDLKRAIVSKGSVEAAATHYGVTRSAIYYRLKEE